MSNDNAPIFPVGYFKFHENQVFNFQLNRWHSLGYAKFEDLEHIGCKINSFETWKNEMVKLADRAISENRLLNAAIYYRAAEFYTFNDLNEKELLYDKFIELFQLAFKREEIDRTNIPYKTGYLPAIRVPHQGERKGTVIVHGGFDSFIEEWYLMMKYLAVNGYDVIGFEGPGQGAALKKYGLAFDTKWEEPIKSILDHFKLSDVTVFGLSMGGWLCMRAAAFEPRIKRVIASGHAIDYMKCLPYLARIIHMWLLNQKRLYGILDSIGMKKARANNAQAWMTNQLMYITGKMGRPMEATKIWLEMNDKYIHAEKVKQDVLLLSGRNDHFVPIKMHKMQIDALKNAKSITDRIFTKKDNAQNHCQIGNIQLLLDVIINWLESIR